ncbi:fungal-specific transcription factor domain-containing protein [Xylaria digitata]|nr:fungal-specific transcription factor domain-containing protein [Xylaria digitata]
MMDASSRPSRRKACDFCVSRKSRCDMLEPTCTNCKAFGMQRRITNITKHARRMNPPLPDQTRPGISRAAREDTIGSRLAHIELQLEQLIADKISTNYSAQVVSLPSLDRSMDVYTATDIWNPGPTPPCPRLCAPLTTGTIMIKTGQLELPPLSLLLPVVDNYFNSYNRFIPLFDQASFMRMILDWHSSTVHQTVVSLAAVNLAQAIAYCLLDDLPLGDPRLSECIRNVQSATTEFMAWNKDLLGVQVLLGMVILFQGTTDLRLATVLIGAAIRLAQAMGLPSRKGLDGLTSTESFQRRLVFWIAYILDRDLAFRSKAPYIQLDAEMDIELPELHGKDQVGILTSSSEGISVNYLLKRVELARIQGRVHDILYSRRSHLLTRDQRLTNISRIEQMLYEWRGTIPDELLHPGGLFRCFSGIPAFLMMDMHNRHLECLFRIHAIFSFDDSWIRRTHCYFSPAVIELGEDEVDGELVKSGLTPLPEVWADCIQYCRACLELFILGNFTEYSRL